MAEWHLGLGARHAHPDPLPSSLAPVRMARPSAACPPAAPARRRGHGGLPARGLPRPRPPSAPPLPPRVRGPAPALRAAWHGGAACPPVARPPAVRPRPCARHGVAAQLACPRLGHGGWSSATASRPARAASPRSRARAALRPPAAWRGLAPALLAVAASLACPRLGAALRPPCPPWRRGSPARDRGPARPTPDVLRSPARRGLLAWIYRDIAALRATWRPSSLAAARATCSWWPRSLARVCGSGPRPSSLARVAYSPVQRLTITLGHLSFMCELSRYDALRQLKVLVLMGLCQKAAITRHGLIMLR
jgi:hypothetical protein